MWVLKYLVCLVSNHAYADIFLDKSPYRYCLRCGRVEPLSGHDEGMLAPVVERIK